MYELKHLDLSVFLIFAALVFLCLMIFLIYASPGSKKLTNIPGPLPSDKKLGNLGDLSQAGSLHEYLTLLHCEYGPITGFFWGERFVVSLAHPDLLKDHTRLFDRASELFLMFEPLISSKSIQYANGVDGRSRRNHYDQSFSHASVGSSILSVIEPVEELVTQLKGMAAKQEHIPLRAFMLALAMKSIIRVAFENDVNVVSDKDIYNLRKHYDVTWTEMEHRLSGSMPTDNDSRQASFDKSLAEVHSFIKKLVNKRRSKVFNSETDKLFIDYLIDYTADKPDGEHMLLADAVTYLVGGFHTSGNLIAWALYYLCLRPDLVSQLRQEIKEVQGSGELTIGVISDMKLLRRVIDETLRCSVLAPWAARYQDKNAYIGGFMVPEGTPVIHALGVVSQDPEFFPEPDEFDPDLHFGKDKFFEPFGIGKRKCPGYRLAYMEIAVWLIVLLTNFDWKLTDPEFRAIKQYGLVTIPKEEIFVTVQVLK